MQSYTHFTTEERACLNEYGRGGKKPSEIRRLLNRNRSSILRELNRNSCRGGHYSPMEATKGTGSEGKAVCANPDFVREANCSTLSVRSLRQCGRRK